LWRGYNLRVVAGVLFLVTWTVDALVRSERLVWFLPDALLRLYPGELAVRGLAPPSVGVPHLLPHPGGSSEFRDSEDRKEEALHRVEKRLNALEEREQQS
jgi:hypothetical protein